ncbi:MAG: kelch repeat-containing protein [Myxococcales bacterium]|nr:hypothetical protein [Polyangiaceae bacterium]MDW8250645.1 kelch repeat-containing protein [Myxococcales bacterium]
MTKRKRLSALRRTLVLAALLAAAPAEALEWQQPGPGDTLEVGLLSPAVVPLADGRTLVVGGLTGALTSLEAVNKAYLIDPSAPSPQKMIAEAASMATARHGHAAVLLPGGKVLVVGGFSDAKGSTALKSAEIYDPLTNTWTLAEETGAERAWATATVLPDGRVLLVGGTNGQNSLDSVEIFDPFAKNGAGKWNGLAPMKINGESLGRHAHSATLLLDGRLLVAGGVRGTGVTQDALLLDLSAPSGQPWSKASNIGQMRAGHTAVRMRGGQVALLGGCSSVPSFEISDNAAAGCVPENGIRFYTPEKNSWGQLSGPNPVNPPLGGRIWVGLRNGWLLAAGGRYKGANGLSEKSVSFLRAPLHDDKDPGNVEASLGSSWSWFEEDGSSKLTLQVPRAFAGVAVDQRGRVLVVGGLKDGFAQKTIEFLDYLDNGAPCPQGLLTPLECASGVCSDGVCCDRRCDSDCDACTKEKTNLGKDGLCGADFAKEGEIGCKLDKALCDIKSNSIDVGRCSGGFCITQVQVCGYFKCEDKKPCPTSCVTSSDCISGKPPVVCTAQKICSPELENGSVCLVHADCASGHCEPNAPASTNNKAPPRVCCAQDCDEDKCDSAGVIRNFCDSNGACKKSYEYCQGFVCNGATCLTSCSTDKDCIQGYFCDQDALCKRQAKLGESCTKDEQCDGKGNVCAEGVCCNDAACKNASCRSCLSVNTGVSDGTCAPVQYGMDPRDFCLNELNEKPCGQTGVCNGGGACEVVAFNAPCAPSSCTDQVQTDFLCNGSGNCVERTTTCPGNLVCDASGSKCKSGCDGDSDCADGFACNTKERTCSTRCEDKRDCKPGFNCNKVTERCVQVATCIDERNLLTKQGEPKSCRDGHRCRDDLEGGAEACLEPCRSSLDCLDGLVCSASGNCRLPPVAAEPSDCFCSLPGRPAPMSLMVLALLALGLAGARQRRRAR